MQNKVTLLDQGTDSLPFFLHVSMCLHFSDLTLVKQIKLENKFDIAIFL